MNRRQLLKRLAWYGGTVSFLDELLRLEHVLAKNISGRTVPQDELRDYYRIVVLGDPHLPVKFKGDKIQRQEELVDAKLKVRHEINAWQDVDFITPVGDICGRFGNEEEYAFAQQYFAKFHKPLFFITGNHDYMYLDSLVSDEKMGHADAATRQLKLNRFKTVFELLSLYYSKQVGRYSLLFLSIDSLESKHAAHISPEQLAWLSQELKARPNAPTLIFFHAPLVGTLLNYNKKVNTPNAVATPAKELEQIIRDNPQIVMWVSGHTHTPATNPSYASSINLFGNKVLNLHNADMDREVIWTNSLYLYPDRITVKTFNHQEHRWLESFERTISV